MCTVRNSPSRRRGFTVIEAVVSMALAGIGIAGALGGIGALSRAQVSMLDKERMQRLAFEKYQEILAIHDFSTPNGDFQDRNESRYAWDMQVAASSIQNLSTLTVTVHPIDSQDAQSGASVSGLVYQPPQTTTTPAPAGGG